MDIYLISTWSKVIGSGHVKRMEAFSYYFKVLDPGCSIYFAYNLTSSSPVPLQLPLNTITVGIDSVFSLLKNADKRSSIAIFDLHETEINFFKDQIDLLANHKALICDFIPDEMMCNLFDILVSGSIVSADNCCENFVFGLQYFIVPYNYINSYQDRSYAIDEICQSRNVFLSVGGTDHNDIVSLIITSFLEIQHKYNLRSLDVYCSSATRAKISHLVLHSGSSLRIITHCSSFANIWNEYLFAITAGGNTLFERICAGVPGLTINQLKRQNGFAEMFQKLHVNINLGMWDSFDSTYFDEAVESLACIDSPIIAKCDLPLDARGGERTAKVIFDNFESWQNHF
jgi:spore coat polysaccharide biosynthesis predicted glycosyltransferase SpsG